jgi:hypothetical protein
MMPCNARASGKKRKSAYDGRRLRRLDGKAVCLDRRAGASLVGLLMLALDLFKKSVSCVTDVVGLR